ncbi:DUF692 domain-containing protein [Sphaerotilus sp.]|uniref:DUF692 domain-containing protein n=1 Tax=Sphaerotilus sp. TaxID=2093942 RepID=UPI00286DE001|nr:DUF692 domain-containing protein [Sphaerotilus sp.]
MPAPTSAGIGLRQPHAALLRQQRPPLGFLEVHSENYFAPGGAARAVLMDLRQNYSISLHGVGLSLGSACGLDPWHLDRLAELVTAVEPVRVSDHASFARVDPGRGAPVWHGSDLLPIAFTDAALAIMVRNVQQVQERLRRPILVENLSAYLGWADDALAEPDFFNALSRRSGCGVLLDVNNLVVNALNAGDDEAAAVRRACAWVDRLAPGLAGEIHLAGYVETATLVIDDHGSRVHPPVWQVYAHTVQRHGPVPTLIEWDTDLPTLAVLLDEAAHADTVLHGVTA